MDTGMLEFLDKKYFTRINGIIGDPPWVGMFVAHIWPSSVHIRHVILSSISNALKVGKM